MLFVLYDKLSVPLLHFVGFCFNVNTTIHANRLFVIFFLWHLHAFIKNVHWRWMETIYCLLWKTLPWFILSQTTEAQFWLWDELLHRISSVDLFPSLTLERHIWAYEQTSEYCLKPHCVRWDDAHMGKHTSERVCGCVCVFSMRGVISDSSEVSVSKWMALSKL